MQRRLAKVGIVVAVLIIIGLTDYLATESGNYHERNPRPPVEKVDLDSLDEIEREIYLEVGEQMARINALYSKEVKQIFRDSCFDCHSTKTVFPWYYRLPGVRYLVDSDIEEGLSHLDMSDDFPFHGHGSPEEDLEEIERVIEEGSMPPWQYKLLHRDSGLNETERQLVRTWIQDARAILKE